MPDPNPHIPEHTHAESDEFVLHIGSDYKNPEDLGGEIEFVVGGEPLKINKTSALYIPAGVVHGLLTWKSVAWPHLQMTIIMGAGTLAEAAAGDIKGSRITGLSPYKKLYIGPPDRKAGPKESRPKKKTLNRACFPYFRH